MRICRTGVCTFLLLLMLFLSSLLAAGGSEAHHGVASLGVAGLEGPGAPLETSTSATLPRRSVLGYLKLDYARFERFTPERDDETNSNTFWLFGLGYGFTSYLSAYLFVPYNVKVLEDNSFNTSGFADISLMGVLGFKYDEGFRLVPEKESLDDLEDWHFTLYGGLSLPTGKPNLRKRDDDPDDPRGIDPGMSTGFGKPAFGVGFTVTKPIHDRLSLVGEVSYLHFLEYEYDDGNHTQFGSEFRLNSALCLRLLTFAGPKLRLDANLEALYLRLGRDRLNGVGERATGGQMLYLLPGVRGYWRNVSLAFGVKVPTWTDLNEEDEQQGGEGKERYRLIGTFTVLF